MVHSKTEMKNSSPFFKFVDHQKVKQLKQYKLQERKEPKPLHLKKLKILATPKRKGIDEPVAQKIAHAV